MTTLQGEAERLRRVLDDPEREMKIYLVGSGNRIHVNGAHFSRYDFCAIVRMALSTVLDHGIRFAVPDDFSLTDEDRKLLEGLPAEFLPVTGARVLRDTFGCFALAAAEGMAARDGASPSDVEWWHKVAEALAPEPSPVGFLADRATLVDCGNCVNEGGCRGTCARKRDAENPPRGV